MKKVLSIVVATIMMFVMCVPSFATKLTTDVPYEHTVTITYNEGGTVLLEGRVCPNGTQVKINRFGEIDLSTIIENGYHLEKVTVNGVDMTSYYKDGNIRITNITDDVHVHFTFQKCSEDPNDKCGKVSMTGTVYLGKEELPNADMSFDLGSIETKTDEDGVEDPNEDLGYIYEYIGSSDTLKEWITCVFEHTSQTIASLDGIIITRENSDES